MNLSMISYKITSSNPIYDGIKSTYLIDKDRALEHWANTHKSFTLVDYEVDGYGGLINKMKLPYRQVSPKSVVVTDQLLGQLKMLKIDKVLTDFAFGFWQDYILKYFEAYTETVEDHEILFFQRRENAEVEELPWWLPHNEIVDLLLLKEFLEGKFIVDSAAIWLPRNVKIETQFIKLESLGITVPFNYSASVRYTLAQDDKYYKQTGVLFPTSMYYNMMVTGWIHAHTASRRYGKTRGIIPQMKVDFLDLQFMHRPRKQIYIAPSDKRLVTMKRYLNQAFEKEIGMGLCTNVQTDNSMKIYKHDEKGNRTDTIISEIQLYSAQSDDVGVGDYYDVGYLDEIERITPRNPEVLSDVLSIATNEFGSLRMVSTINKKGKYTDFVKYLQMGEEIKYDYKAFFMSLYFKYGLNKLDYAALEKGNKKEIAKLLAIDFLSIRQEIKFYLNYTSTRVPGDKVERYSVQERAQIKKILLNEWILSYTTERLCQLPEEMHAVEFEQQIVDHSYFEWKKYDQVVISYDVSNWWAWDSWAVEYWGYDKMSNKVEFFREVELKGDINSQYDHVVNLYKTESVNFVKTWELSKVHLIYDQRGIGFALTALFDRDKIPVICYQSTSSEDWWNRKERTYNVWKNYSWNLLKFNIATWAIVINSACSCFINEFKHFKETKSESWYTKIQAEQWYHDDFVTGGMMANWYIMDVLGGKHTLTQKHKPVEIDDVTPEWTIERQLLNGELIWDGKRLIKPGSLPTESSLDLFGY